MSIGDLYDADNVVVGQAAVFVAVDGTPLIDLAKWNQNDPFDPTPWVAWTITQDNATSFTLTVVRADGSSEVTGTLTLSGLTAANVQTALEGLDNVGVGKVKVTGTTTTGPFYVAFDEGLNDAVVTLTPTGGDAAIVGPLWQAVGATEQGWQLGADKSTQSIAIEEQSTPVGTTITSQNISIAGSLSEDITKTLALAMNAAVAHINATSTVPGYDKITPSDVPLYYAVGMVTTNAHGLGRLIYAPKWTSLGNVAAAFRRAAGQRLYAVNFQTVCATDEIAIYEFTAPRTP